MRDVQVLSSPSSSEYYDSHWSSLLGDKGEFEEFRRDRRIEIIKLVDRSLFNRLFQNSSAISQWGSPRDLQDLGIIGKNILDLCCGTGSYTVGMLEFGANSVTMVDGSHRSLIDMDKKIQQSMRNGTVLPQMDIRNIDIRRIQMDCNFLGRDMKKYLYLNNFSEFDLAICRMALHHLRCPFSSIIDVMNTIKVGGRFYFNFFSFGATPPIIRHLRSHFMEKDYDYVFKFLSLFGMVPKVVGKHSLKQIAANDSYFSYPAFPKEFKDTINSLNHIQKIYGLEALQNKINPEDLNTPYIHNLDFEVICRFVKGVDGIALVRERCEPEITSGWFCIEKTSDNIKFDKSMIPKDHFNHNSQEYMYLGRSFID